MAVTLKCLVLCPERMDLNIALKKYSCKSYKQVQLKWKRFVEFRYLYLGINCKCYVICTFTQRRSYIYIYLYIDIYVCVLSLILINLIWEMFCNYLIPPSKLQRLYLLNLLIYLEQLSFSWYAFLSDYLTQSYTAQNEFHQKLPPVGFELTASRSSVWCSANCASQESVEDFWSELSFVSCTTSHVWLCLFLESIEHDFIKGFMIHTNNQIVT